jgi:hypothetical protein
MEAVIPSAKRYIPGFCLNELKKTSGSRSRFSRYSVDCQALTFVIRRYADLRGSALWCKFNHIVTRNMVALGANRQRGVLVHVASQAETHL